MVSRPKEPPSNAPNQPNQPNPPKLIAQPEPKQKTTKPVRPTPLLPTAPQFPGDFPAYPPPPSFYPYQPRPNMDLRPRFIKPANIPSTPPTAANNARVAVPPYSVLQPAYIAWPTRKAYCPRAKQWVHPRPTIIPLSFTRPPGAQMNNSASQAIPPDNMGGFPFYPPQWGQYPVKEEPMAMHPMIPDLHCATQEKKETK
uniref:Uncharacterized protein n=1 Tax=Ciona savignyi TaxID=51511 RepID=H2ZEF4_CIOSA